MSTQEQPRSKSSIGRKLFLVAALVAALYLSFKIVSFVHEARVVVNIGTDSTDTPQKRVVNKSPFTAPANGQLRLDQIDMMLHIIESSDSIVTSSNEGARTNRIVELLNEYTLSLDEYRWIRSAIAREIPTTSQKSASSKTSLGVYEQLLRKDFIKHRRFFIDSLDRQLL